MDSEPTSPDRIPTAEEIEALFAAGRMVRIGDGSRRVCYRIPGANLCVKGYRTEEELFTRMNFDGTMGTHALKASVLREIRRNRFSDRGNTCCQEWRYWLELKRRLPPDVFAVFPSVCARVLLPSRGWCLVEELILNADGSPSRTVQPELESRNRHPLALAAAGRVLCGLRDSFARHGVRFYDPPNVLVQLGRDPLDFRLRIADFEPASRALIPLDRICPFLVGPKVRRRFRHYFEWMRIPEVGADAPDPLRAAGVPRTDRAVFLFVLWERARTREAAVLEDLARHFTILKQFDVTWPRRRFTANLAAFYGWRGRFCWWNKARKCGRGTFRAIVVEDPAPRYETVRDTSGHVLRADAEVCRVKKEARRLSGHSNIVHSSVTLAETRHQMRALLACTLEEFLVRDDLDGSVEALVDDRRPIPFMPMEYE